MHQYAATVIRVIDGDTVELAIDLGFHVALRETCRASGIDAPELRGSSRTGGQAAKIAAEQFLPAGSRVRVQTVKSGSEKFGRYLAAIELSDGRDFATEMIRLGFATEYHGGKREP